MPEQYLALRRSAARYLASDLSKATARQQAALAQLARWPTANETDIARGLVESRWPVTVRRRGADGAKVNRNGAEPCSS